MKSMGKWALLSAGLHGIIIVFAIVGLLDYKTDVLDIAQPLPVDLVETIEETAKSQDPLPSSPEKEEPKDDIKTAVEPETVPESIPEESIALPKDKPKDPEINKDLKPIEPPSQKPKPKKKPKPKSRDFDALMKNLAADDPKQRKGKGGEVSDHLAASELDRMRKQIEDAWHVPAGVKNMHQTTVRVTIRMNPDRTVRDVRVVNKALMVDSTYKILAESVLRAVSEFRHKPLLLPVNKYKIWQEINMEFDPRNLL